MVQQNLLRVLLVEDSEDDEVLIRRTLSKSDFEISLERVETAEAMLSALQEKTWDLVLSDYRLPQFSGTEALSILQNFNFDIPFIVVSGAIGEITAVQIMKAGAHDYIMKSSMVRLIPAIERELREAKLRCIQRASEEDLRLAAKVFESSVEGIVITDATTKIVRVNKAFSNITGYQEAEILGLTPSVLRSGKHNKKFYSELWASIENHGYWQGEIWNRRKNGEVYPEWLTISVVRNEQNQISHYVGGFTDLSLQKRAEERVQRLTHYDALTDLPNRSLFRARFMQPMLRAEEEQLRVVLMHLDLDRFVTVNDTLGHLVGDRLLQQAGRRLAANIHDRDFLARIGGDEFAIACPDLSHDVDISSIAQSIMNKFSEPFWVQGSEVFLTPSIGIAIYPEDSDNYDDLIACADAAVHHAKREGGQFKFYQKSMNKNTAERLTMENALRRALDRQEFILHFQPQINLNNNHIVGVEALLRWQHADEGMVFPDRFIPLLEETGLIVPVGEWVIRSACDALRVWQKAGLKNIPIAINLSPTQFRNKDLVELVGSVIHETGIDANYLELEITEGSVMEDPQSALNVLNALHEMGIKLAIDDFGTGYSSLSYLKRFPLDVLKIDKSFVSDIPLDKDDAAIVDTIIAMAHRLKLKVIAEGIENQQQLDYLNSNDCDTGQGYLFARPMDLDEFLSFSMEDVFVH